MVFSDVSDSPGPSKGHSHGNFDIDISLNDLSEMLRVKADLLSPEKGSDKKIKLKRKIGPNFNTTHSPTKFGSSGAKEESQKKPGSKVAELNEI